MHACIAKPLLRLMPVLLGLLLLAPPPSHGVERTLCEICGRDWGHAPSRIRFTLQLGRHNQTVFVCSPLCMCKRLERHPDIPPEGALIIDYASLEADEPRWVAAENAFCLYGVKGDTKAAHEPFVAAFARRAKAEELQKTLGGELCAWDDVFKKCTKLAAESKDGEHHPYQKLKLRPD